MPMTMIRKKAGAVRVLLAGLVVGLAAAGVTVWQLAPSAMATSTPFSGTPAIGALFSVKAHQLGSHFCTASVVDSPNGDVLVTAAHCVQDYSASAPKGLAFVPGYDNGSAPYGVWKVTRIFVDQAWASASDPDDDVAFLTVTQHYGMAIESITGAESLGIGQPASGLMRVIGYPESQSQPITCRNWVSSFSPTQLEFDCRGYTDGTSGGPFLADVNATTGEGTVIGVIGGYQQGGDTPDVSYAATFSSGVQALYNQAVADS
jgi:V8-like Glu-specific endopeptidase